MTLSRPELKALLEDHGLSPSRALGQNFVGDPNTVRKIVRLAGVGAGSVVLEIGPGLGSLTLALVEAGAEVVVVEIDRHLIPVLTTVLQGTGVRIVHGDALEVDLAGVLPEATVEATLVANLPYNVSVPLVMRVLESFPQITALLIMVQREVGERLVAGPGEEAYGAVSAKVAYFAHGQVVGRVPAAVFLPRPNVESVLVRLDRHDVPPSCTGIEPGALFHLIRQAFSQRRKMLRSVLRGMVDEAGFQRAEVPGTLRAEELSLEQFARLAAEVSL